MITYSNPISQKNIVIASHSLGEAITQCIINNKEAMGATITVVTLQELMFDYEIFDELGDAVEHIRWFKDSSQCISNKNHLLLNRVLYVPDELFKRFTPIDREYARRELEAYIGFSFNAFSGVGNHSANGYCGDAISLPQQWKKMSDLLNLQVPTYYWGPSNINSLNKNRLVYSSIFNVLNWKITTKPPTETPVFCFEKPQGEPVFILSIGSEHLITSNITLSLEMEERLNTLATLINNIFKCFISEILFFIDNETLCFGCMNHEIVRSTSNPMFNHFVSNNLINEFYKCVN